MHTPQKTPLGYSISARGWTWNLPYAFLRLAHPTPTRTTCSRKQASQDITNQTKTKQHTNDQNNTKQINIVENNTKIDQTTKHNTKIHKTTQHKTKPHQNKKQTQHSATQHKSNTSTKTKNRNKNKETQNDTKPNTAKSDSMQGDAAEYPPERVKRSGTLGGHACTRRTEGGGVGGGERAGAGSGGVQQEAGF